MLNYRTVNCFCSIFIILLSYSLFMTVLFMNRNITSFYERSEIEITKDMNVLKSHPKRLTFTEFFEFVYYNYDKHSENVYY